VALVAGGVAGARPIVACGIRGCAAIHFVGEEERCQNGQSSYMKAPYSSLKVVLALGP